MKPNPKKRSTGPKPSKEECDRAIAAMSNLPLSCADRAVVLEFLQAARKRLPYERTLIKDNPPPLRKY
jgi:hypothetical protein